MRKKYVMAAPAGACPTRFDRLYKLGTVSSESRKVSGCAIHEGRLTVPTVTLLADREPRPLRSMSGRMKAHRRSPATPCQETCDECNASAAIDFTG